MAGDAQSSPGIVSEWAETQDVSADTFCVNMLLIMVIILLLKIPEMKSCVDKAVYKIGVLKSGLLVKMKMQILNGKSRKLINNINLDEQRKID